MYFGITFNSSLLFVCLVWLQSSEWRAIFLHNMILTLVHYSCIQNNDYFFYFIINCIDILLKLKKYIDFCCICCLWLRLSIFKATFLLLLCCRLKILLCENKSVPIVLPLDFRSNRKETNTCVCLFIYIENNNTC